MKKIIAVLIIFFLFSPLVLSQEERYRPSYSFGDYPFEYLPPFPEDFYEMSSLYATQTITATQLPEEYLQPELIPNSEYQLNRIYKEDSYTFGSYGIFFYPSRFDVYDIQEGEYINISALIYAQFGIEKYQGVKLIETGDDSIDVVVSSPKNILLKPTAPHFHNGWMQVIKISIYVKKEINATFEIKETIPDENYETLWKQTYGSNYTSGSSLLGMRIPKFTVNLYRTEKDEIVSSIDDRPFSYQFPLLLFFGLIIILIIIYTKRKHARKEIQEK